MRIVPLDILNLAHPSGRVVNLLLLYGYTIERT